MIVIKNPIKFAVQTRIKQKIQTSCDAVMDRKVSCTHGIDLPMQVWAELYSPTYSSVSSVIYAATCISIVSTIDNSISL